ncbi:hypothetical protein [Caballeronia choica]|nr:hypothetical protein [Caballeronia choica]
MIGEMPRALSERALLRAQPAFDRQKVQKNDAVPASRLRKSPR